MLASDAGIVGGEGTIDDALEGILQLVMSLLELAGLTCQAEGARVHELQSDFDGHALVLCHKVPVLADEVQDLFDGLIAGTVCMARPVAVLALAAATLCWRALDTGWASDGAGAAVAGREATASIATRPAVAVTVAVTVSVTIAAGPSFNVVVLGQAAISPRAPGPVAFGAGPGRIVVGGSIHAPISARAPRAFAARTAIVSRVASSVAVVASVAAGVAVVATAGVVVGAVGVASSIGTRLRVAWDARHVCVTELGGSGWVSTLAL